MSLHADSSTTRGSGLIYVKALIHSLYQSNATSQTSLQSSMLAFHEENGRMYHTLSAGSRLSAYGLSNTPEEN